MNIIHRIRLIWRRFSPLEERLFAAIREVLPAQTRAIYDAQIAGIAVVHRHSNELYFGRNISRSVDVASVPTFAHTGEFRLAEVQFCVGSQRFKATLNCFQGHVLCFEVTPNPKWVAFADWDDAPSTRLLSDPTTLQFENEPHQIPDSWREFLANHSSLSRDWSLLDSATAFRVAFADGVFLVLAEREGPEFVLHRIEPTASTLFYLESPDAVPEPINGGISDFFQQADRQDL